MNIRQIRIEDRAEWNVLWQGYLAFYSTALSDTVTDSTWDRITSPDSDFFALVATQADGKLIGFVHCLMHLNTWGISQRCYLEDLYVSDTLRGGGVGRALIEAVYTEADKRGAGGVYWFTNSGNTTARRLYDNIGQLSDYVRYDRV